MELNFLEIFGTIVGLVYLWLEYRASIYLWIAGIVMPAIYIFVYYKAGLYADFGINIYYLIAAIYGWFFWMWGHRKKKSQQSADASTYCQTVEHSRQNTSGKSEGKQTNVGQNISKQTSNHVV